LRTSLVLSDVQTRIRELVHAVFRRVPAGVGSQGAIPDLSFAEMDQVLTKGARWAIERGFGSGEDLSFIEDNGRIQAADPTAISSRAKERGRGQMGTLGSGNHFIEVDVVQEIYDAGAAACFGIDLQSICILLHSGSRGLGHQVCTDHLEGMAAAVRKYGIRLPDRQLACAPIQSPEGQSYYAAMKGAANYAWANRQIMSSLIEQAWCEALHISPRVLGCRLVCDVSHNIAKKEKHVIAGQERAVMIHRKGATRAFAAGSDQVPERYRRYGQPVLVPGDMGSGSYILLGTDQAMDETYGSSCHGAGRVKSRAQAIKDARGKNPFQEMEEHGVIVLAAGKKTIAEEMPSAYKNVDEVVESACQAGISRKVARLRPIGCIKG